MIKVLRRRITLMLSIFVSLLLIVVLVFINIFSNMQAKNAIYDLLEASINEVAKERTTVINNMSAVFIQGDKPGDKPTILFTDDDVEFSDDELCMFARQVTFEPNVISSGLFDGRFFASKMIGKGTLVLVTNGEDILERAKTLRNVSVIFGVVGILISIWVATLIAKWLVRPVEETIANERAFISDASHELKTPLAVISSNADALETETGDNKWLNCIKSESMRMSGLINNMLTVSRIEKNNDRLTYKKVNLSSCTEEIVMNFEAPAFEKGVLIDTDVQQGVNVHGSEEKLKQVIEILLDNAVKYVNAKGHIKVTLKSKLAGAVLTVENTGSYIEKADQKKVFERFYRTDASRSKPDETGKPRSYGLGLAIAKRIVEAHEGSISATSSKNTLPDGTEELSTQFKVSL